MTEIKTGKEKKERKIPIWPVAVCLLLALGIFVLLLGIEERRLSVYEKGSVVIAVSDIAGDQEITEANVNELFTVVERPLTDIPQAVYMETEELIGQYVTNGIDEGSMITERMVGALQITAKDHILLGVDMEEMEQSVVGTLRTGDRIDIYAIKWEEEELSVEKVLENIVVDRSYTSAGTLIQKEDVSSVAQYLTIPIHKDAVGAYLRDMEGCQIRVVKHPGNEGAE